MLCHEPYDHFCAHHASSNTYHLGISKYMLHALHLFQPSLPYPPNFCGHSRAKWPHSPQK